MRLEGMQVQGQDLLAIRATERCQDSERLQSQAAQGNLQEDGRETRHAPCSVTSFQIRLRRSLSCCWLFETTQASVRCTEWDMCTMPARSCDLVAYRSADDFWVVWELLLASCAICPQIRQDLLCIADLDRPCVVA